MIWRFNPLELGIAFGIGLFALALIQGFFAASPALAVLEGMASSLFWLISAVGPSVSERIRSAADAASALAAGATGGAVMASVGHGWQAVAGMFAA